MQNNTELLFNILESQIETNNIPDLENQSATPVENALQVDSSLQVEKVVLNNDTLISHDVVHVSITREVLDTVVYLTSILKDYERKITELTETLSIRDSRVAELELQLNNVNKVDMLLKVEITFYLITKCLKNDLS